MLRITTIALAATSAIADSMFATVETDMGAIKLELLLSDFPVSVRSLAPMQRPPRPACPHMILPQQQWLTAGAFAQQSRSLHTHSAHTHDARRRLLRCLSPPGE